MWVGEVELRTRGQWATVEMTAYCPCARCCGVRRERTFIGVNTNEVPYAFAADRTYWDIGNQVLVPVGLGILDHVRPHCRVFDVDDRGGGLDTEALRGTPRLDLRVRDHTWAVRFGRRQVRVFVLAKP